MHHVSILIVLEISFEDVSAFFCLKCCKVSILIVLEISFEAEHSYQKEQRHEVSILIVLEISFEVARFFGLFFALLEFQSLLSWRSVLKRSATSLVASSDQGFNPYCLGFQFWIRRDFHNTRKANPVQSLLSWRSVLKLIAYFVIRKAKPVSILIVLEISFEEQPTHHSLMKHGVSILIVLEISFEGCLYWLAQYATPCFNPYCLGYQFWRLQ